MKMVKWTRLLSKKEVRNWAYFTLYFMIVAITALNKQLGITACPTKVILSTTGQQWVKTDQSAISLNSFEEFLKEKK